MPKATHDPTGERIDLTTLPAQGDEEGGYILARRLTYGEKLYRRAMVSGLKVEAGKGKDFAGEMQLVNEQATLFDFKNCIVDHNLEDDSGTKLDFTKVSDVKRLDPRVGEEIDTKISEMNNFEEDEEN